MGYRYQGEIPARETITSFAGSGIRSSDCQADNNTLPRGTEVRRSTHTDPVSMETDQPARDVTGQPLPPDQGDQARKRYQERIRARQVTANLATGSDPRPPASGEPMTIYGDQLESLLAVVFAAN